MGAIEDRIKNAFPGLSLDSSFEVTSKQDFKYNCIAWASIVDNKYIWPGPIRTLDGVTYWWNEDLDHTETLENFVKYFESLGYEKCASSISEEGVRKIAIYGNLSLNKITHAARERRDGLWTSKLGPEQDIVHSSPADIEGRIYGEVLQVMKKSNI